MDIVVTKMKLITINKGIFRSPPNSHFSQALNNTPDILREPNGVFGVLGVRAALLMGRVWWALSRGMKMSQVEVMALCRQLRVVGKRLGSWKQLNS